ncbi:beta-L-arabinofuranosidase domain-containing protein [Dyella terrae]|uniref:beta-L-arabinofuranosidase domain-containing protein n=1 Tax=Dyella terrae TaxID=522259 RepID=UPI0023D903F4|nr:beta-L-arabinofuranosidase domain-containing protein [Dyella terrae]ULU24687.1 glycoside hydrolase family 127 protein [Dyella terrae]
MPERVDHRRRFLKRAATTLASLAVLPKAMALAPDVADTATPATPGFSPGVQDQPVRRVYPFDLRQVRLLDSDFSRAAAINQRYLHTLPVDRLVHTFRVQAGIPSNAKPFGGWEKPDCELRGHFTGGSLSFSRGYRLCDHGRSGVEATWR